MEKDSIKEKIAERRAMTRVINKIRKKEPYSKLFNFAVKNIWKSTVKGNGWWSYRDLSDEYLVSVFNEIVRREPTFHTRLNKNHRHKYKSFLLKSGDEQDEEIIQILSNARTRTIERFMKETGKKRKSKKDIACEFDEAHGYLSPEEQRDIKKNRNSGLNRYKSVFFVRFDIDRPSLDNNPLTRIEERELLEKFSEKLTTKEFDFMVRLLKSSCEEIAQEDHICVASVRKKKRRLELKVRKIIS